MAHGKSLWGGMDRIVGLIALGGAVSAGITKISGARSKNAKRASTPHAPETSTVSDIQKQRVTYLMDVYKLYHGHINAMFNYFLILSGLIATAYVQSANETAHMNKAVPACIGLFGALMSYIGLRIHRRSREMMDTIEASLRQQERLLFSDGGGFLTAETRPASWLGRHKYQFQLTYWAFVIAFLLLFTYSAAIYVDLHLMRIIRPSMPVIAPP